MTTSTTQIRRRRRWRFTLAAILTAGIAGLVSTTSSTVSASTEKVVIYFAVCDGSGASDTVKIKKINEDGTGLTVVGDTTIPHCIPNANATRYLSGLAVSDGYAYFSWITGDFASAGIGRIKTDGTGTAELSYVTAPAGVGWFQMSPTPLNGYLYVYVHDGGQTPSNFRIMRMSTASGQLSNCYTPSGSLNAMSIGVGKDAVYYSSASTEISDNQKLHKVSGDCSSASEVANLNNFGGTGMLHVFETSFIATLVAESTDKMFLTTNHAVNNTYGLSSFDTAGSISNFQAHLFGATSNPNDGPASVVWGFNYLYFKDSGATKMYRVAPGGVPEQIFADHIKGVLHHFSVVKETSTPPPVAKTPLVIGKKGVTGKQIASDLGVTIAKGSKIKLTVAKSSRKVCTVKKSRVVSTKAGATCKVTVTITPKKGKAIKRTTSFTTS